MQITRKITPWPGVQIQRGGHNSGALRRKRAATACIARTRTDMMQKVAKRLIMVRIHLHRP
ncbi:MAG: hypothetical protein ROZ09_07670 [Thiobacillus sp.]|jgi:hypothetical protein|uniref:hypothetical protein n=1 Tax=Thiobacillus sp. TaxID=924 RepID=UPI002895E15C|nr:hypothetical protein [Thiobacillus sp.]MDT3706693.1 hypothetical protein [Thiobacillus sp.]